jgi:hypothetical protein
LIEKNNVHYKLDPQRKIGLASSGKKSDIMVSVILIIDAFEYVAKVLS